MNPLLLLPAGLAALAALALPLLLHLARREDRRPVDFAALRWLSERVRPRRNLRFEEPLLLALRLLLVALLALLLARPALEADAARTPWIVAAPQVGTGAFPAVTDVERRWLLPGFPPVDDAAPSDAALRAAGTAPPDADVSLASLLRELDMLMPPDAPLTVLVPPVLDGMDAERPRLSRPVDWRVVGDAAARPDAGAPGPGRAPPRLVFLRDDDGTRYLRAVAAAWRTQQVDGDAGPGPEVRVWTGAATLPAAEQAWVEAGGTVLLAHDADVGTDDERRTGTGPIAEADTGAGTDSDTTAATPLTGPATLWTDAEGHPLLHARRLGAGRVLQWTRPLDPAVFPALLEPDFPHRLHDAIQPSPPPARVLAAEHAPVVADVGPWPAGQRDLRPWLALLVALVFVLERWLAAGPRGDASGLGAAASKRVRTTRETAA